MRTWCSMAASDPRFLRQAVFCSRFRIGICTDLSCWVCNFLWSYRFYRFVLRFSHSGRKGSYCVPLRDRASFSLPYYWRHPTIRFLWPHKVRLFFPVHMLSPCRYCFQQRTRQHIPAPSAISWTHQVMALTQFHALLQWYTARDSDLYMSSRYGRSHQCIPDLPPPFFYDCWCCLFSNSRNSRYVIGSISH